MIYYNSKFYNEFVDDLIKAIDENIPSFHVIRASGFNNLYNHSFIIKNSTTKSKVEFFITKSDNTLHCKMYERCENIPANIKISYILKDEFKIYLQDPFSENIKKETIKKIVSFLLTQSIYVKRIRDGYKLKIPTLRFNATHLSDNQVRAAKVIGIENNSENNDFIKLILEHNQGHYTGSYKELEKLMINSKDSFVGSYIVINKNEDVAIMHQKRFNSMFEYI